MNEAPYLASRIEPPTMKYAVGVVRNVDLIAREIEVSVAGKDIRFDVPPDCPVILRGERIKLRLIQKGDRVVLAYRILHALNEVYRLEVQPETP